jgi:hypothetical protein
MYDEGVMYGLEASVASGIGVFPVVFCCSIQCILVFLGFACYRCVRRVYWVMG